MKARCCLLTHFSQRFPKIPEFGDLSETQVKFALAFDFMSIKLIDFWRFSHFLPAMREVFRGITAKGSIEDGGLLDDDEEDMN